MTSYELRIRGLGKKYEIEGREFYALRDLQLDIPQASFTTIVGASGCGKTTFLRLIGGLELPSEGSIRFSSPPEHAGSERATPRAAAHPKIGLVFQEPRLMPWLTVRNNILFPLERRGGREGGAARDRLARDILSSMELTAFENAFPRQLSGGMAQRVSIGRTLCYDPDIILMDEPFAALDYFTRRSMRDLVLRLFRASSKTILFVTHHVEEAISLGQRVVVMSAGRIIGIFPVDIPFPRDASSPGFVDLQRRILKCIEGAMEDTSRSQEEKHD